MRDSTGGAQKPLYIEATLEQGNSRVAQRVARMQLSQVAALLIERWDELDSQSREEILRKLEYVGSLPIPGITQDLGGGFGVSPRYARE